MMNSAELIETEPPETERPLLIRFPLGLLGFESVKEYHLLERPGEEPFLWLQMTADPNHAFLVISPAMICRNYQPDLGQEDVACLGLARPEDARLLIIVTLHPQGPPTANLKGPLVINWRTLVAKQVIPVNAAELPLQYPLPVAM